MCYGCWEEAGKPQIVNPMVLHAVATVEALYEVHCAGGGMHIVTDDWNCEDSDVKFCREWMGGPDYEKTWHERPTQAEWDCLVAFEALSEDERYSALAIHDGFTA